MITRLAKAGVDGNAVMSGLETGVVITKNYG